MSTINNLPPFIYIPMLVIGIIILLATLISHRKSYPTPYKISFCFFIVEGVLLIILKMQLFNHIRSELTLLAILSLIIGLSILFISGYRYNKKNGIKMDPFLKKIMMAGLVAMIICIILLVFILYMKNR